MIKRFKNINIMGSWYVPALALILLFHFFNNYFWIITDQSFTGNDVLCHLTQQSELYNRLRFVWANGQMSFFKKMYNTLLPFRENFEWPRLTYFVTFLFQMCFGNSPQVTLMTSFFYFFILVLFVYLLGVELSGKKLGLLSAFIVSVYPCFVGLARKYGLDLPLTAVLTATIYYLVKSEYFTNRKYSVIFGITLGLGILTKMQILFFIIGPLLYVIYKIIGQGSYGKKQDARITILNLFIALFIAAIISSILWLYALKGILQHFLSEHFIVSQRRDSEVNNAFTIYGIFFYTLETLRNASLLLFIVFLVSLVFIRRIDIKEKGMMIAWIIVPYFIFTIIVGNKMGRFYFPAFPAIAVLSAASIVNIRTKAIRIAAIFLILLTGIAQVLVLSWYQSEESIFRPKIVYAGLYSRLKDKSEWCHSPYVNYNACDIALKFTRLIKLQKKNIYNIAFISVDFDQLILLDYHMLLNLHNARIRMISPVFLKTDKFWHLGFWNNVENLDYIIVFDKAEYHNPRYYNILSNMTYLPSEENVTAAIKRFQEYECLAKILHQPFDDTAVYLFKKVR